MRSSSSLALRSASSKLMAPPAFFAPNLERLAPAPDDDAEVRVAPSLERAEAEAVEDDPLRSEAEDTVRGPLGAGVGLDGVEGPLAADAGVLGREEDSDTEGGGAARDACWEGAGLGAAGLSQESKKSSSPFFADASDASGAATCMPSTQMWLGPN